MSAAKNEPHDDRSQRPATPSNAPTNNISEFPGLPGITRAMFQSVRDDTYFRHEEQAIWFAIWQALQTSTPAEIEQVSRGDRSYLQIYRQTDELRGQLVSVTGTIHRSERMTAPTNDAGIVDYWQNWLLPKNSHASPIVVYSLAAPPPATEDQVTTIGCVYKRWAYRAEEGLRVAPVLLAKDWQPVATPAVIVPTGPGTLPSFRQFAMISIAIAVSATVLAWLLLRRPYPRRVFGDDTHVSLSPPAPRDE